MFETCTLGCICNDGFHWLLQFKMIAPSGSLVFTRFLTVFHTQLIEFPIPVIYVNLVVSERLFWGGYQYPISKKFCQEYSISLQFNIPISLYDSLQIFKYPISLALIFPSNIPYPINKKGQYPVSQCTLNKPHQRHIKPYIHVSYISLVVCVLELGQCIICDEQVGNNPPKHLPGTVPEISNYSNALSKV